MSTTFVREFETRRGSLSLHQIGIGDTGCVVWDAALVLSGYVHELDRREAKYWRNKTVLELGAGTGVVGLVAACLGAHSTLTDLPKCLPLIEQNIEANKALFDETGSAKADILIWGRGNASSQAEIEIDVVLMSDLIYYEESLGPLIETLEAVTSPRTLVLMSYEERESEMKRKLVAEFFDLFSRTFQWEKVDEANQDSRYQSDDIIVITARKRK
ncbi:protein N-lysine methyltransferase METTL21D-like [Oscarella lobularis]|uniref:protein N-lysine methyltransferase METTL21D-like n=1 Tax=Oscarella lobularis TaxID=121494 RepID=UPI0033144226